MLVLGACGAEPAAPVELSTASQNQLLTLTALYDASLQAPICRAMASTCDSGPLLAGRGRFGGEANAPNTLTGSCPDGTSGGFHTSESLDRLTVSTLDGSALQWGSTVRIDATVWAPSPRFDRLDLYYAADATGTPFWSFLTTLTPAGTGLQTLSTTYVLPRLSQQAIRGQFRFESSPGLSGPCIVGPSNDRDDLVFTVIAPDLPPSTVILSPTAGTTVAGPIEITATGADARGIARVEFYRDDTVLLGTATRAPYTVSWNPYGTSNGAHTLTSKAYDVTGNPTVSWPISIDVENPEPLDPTPPTTTLDAPLAGAVVSGDVVLQASASDDVGVAKLEFYVDTELIETATAAPYTATWNSVSVVDGSHVLTSKAYDATGNVATAAVSVTVRNTAAPVLLGSYDATLATVQCATVGASCDSGTLEDGFGASEPHAPNTLDHCGDASFGTYHVDESLDRLKLSTLDGSGFAPGKAVKIEATVWAYTFYTFDALDLYYAPDAANPSWIYIATLSPTRAGPQTLSTIYYLPSGTRQAIRGQFRFGNQTGPCTRSDRGDHDDLVFAVQH